MSKWHRLHGGSRNRNVGRGVRASDDFVTRREFDSKIETVLQTMRADSAALRAEFTAAVAEIKVEVRTLGAEMRGEMKALAARMDGLEDRIGGQIDGIKQSIGTMKWAFSALVAVVGLVPLIGQGLLVWKLSTTPSVVTPVASVVSAAPEAAASAPALVGAGATIPPHERHP
jgi:BMFP domain-containing protein YqiC